MASKMDEDGGVVVAATAFRGEEEATTWESDEGCIMIMDRYRYYLVTLSSCCTLLLMGGPSMNRVVC